MNDGWMDTQHFGWYNIIPTPLLVEGHKNPAILSKKKKKKKKKISIKVACAVL